MKPVQISYGCTRCQRDVMVLELPPEGGFCFHCGQREADEIYLKRFIPADATEGECPQAIITITQDDGRVDSINIGNEEPQDSNAVREPDVELGAERDSWNTVDDGGWAP